MQPIGAVDICNLALDRLNTPPISSILAPTTTNEDICARHYDQTRRQLLRSFIFNFARKSDTILADPLAPTHPEFANAFDLPTDFIRLLSLGDRLLFGGAVPSCYMDFSNNYIYCDSATQDSAAATPSIEINYIFDAQSVPKFDPLFVNVLKLQLAANMAYKFSPKPSLLKGLYEELHDANLAAAAVAGQEKPPRRVQRSRISEVRRSGGIYRNNTIITGP